LKEGAAATPDELRQFLTKSFVKWQLPDAFVFLAEIPRTSVGKFKKIALREQIRELELGVREEKSRFPAQKAREE
jgi:fatty-acyl-CoA synthase